MDARAEFERCCGDGCKYISHEVVAGNTEFCFEIPAVGRMFVVAVKPDLDAESQGREAGIRAKEKHAEVVINGS